MASKSAFRRPQLKLEEFFDGSVKGFGFMHTRFGKLAQQFDISAEERSASAKKAAATRKRNAEHRVS